MILPLQNLAVIKMFEAVVEVDVHGMNAFQAKTAIDAKLRKSKGAYRIRVIHGYNSGTVLRDMIRKEYGGNHKLVKRIELGINQGQTDIVLKEI